MPAPVNAMFLIPSLVAAGAERQLCELVRHMDPERFRVHVVVFYDPGSYEGLDYTQDLVALPHVTLHSLHKKRGAGGYAGALLRLLALVRRVKPDVLHGYMDGNLPVFLAGKLLGRPMAWGIRSMAQEPDKYSRTGRAIHRMTAFLSPGVDLVVYNSEAGRRSHEGKGMRPRHSLVIPNGFDTTRFRPDRPAGEAQRRAWGIPPETPLVGIVGRLDQVKDHPTFLRAAARVARELPEARFVVVGSGPADYTAAMKAQAAELGIADKVLWAGGCSQMAPVYNALTLLALSSTYEGFPNVLGEAMACGIPCVATRAGDAAELINEPDLIAETGDDAALAGNILRILRIPAEEWQARARTVESRILSSFTVQVLARKTEQALADLLS